jgi:hypothetical protein
VASNAPLFRPDTFDLLAGEFARNLSHYRNYTDGDAIAGMFLGCALDIIDCTYYTFAKSFPADKAKFAGSFVMGCQQNHSGAHLDEHMLNPGLDREVVDHHGILLDALREKYQWLIRGPRDSCWNESVASIADKKEVCGAQSRCHDKGASGTDLESKCESYFTSWRTTMLAIDGTEVLPGDTDALAEEIERRCRILSLLTTREGLADFLRRGYGQHKPEEDMRTMRGVIVRLLTMLVDESLANLNQKMNLPPEEALYFTRPMA